MRKNAKKVVSYVLTTALSLATVFSPGSGFESSTAKAATTPARVSVHDPSVAVSKEGTYYVFGSHIDAAKSTDLINWKTFTNGYAKTNNQLYGNLSQNLKKSFAWAGENDSDSKGGFSVWAPDVFWNKDYVNTDGTKGAYMIYFCTSSTAIRSVISYAVSQNIEGPYTFVDTLVYSGFTKTDQKDGNSNINKNYKNTNIQTLINNGTLKDGVNSEWFTGNNYNNAYGPNAIDPTVFEDKDGKLWMTYGSWSGGIYILELDKTTGKVIYPGKNSKTADGRVVDEYFGTKIAGGFRKSGEGPYILYDKDSDYYYLYVSYEGLAQNGGYNMRLFRSKSPDGPYTDAAGHNAVLTNAGQSHKDIGIKVMGNYKLPYLDRAYKAPGHNSALIDSKHNSRYLIYHTRFERRDETHEVRVHQQFLNEEGWPVTAPYENKGDKISSTGYSNDDIIGEYAFVDHGTQNDAASIIKTKTVTLQSNGTITGGVTGTWAKKDGTYYMNATISGVKYSGVFFLQTAENTSAKTMTFSAIGTNNHTIWGVKKPISLQAGATTLYVGGNTGKTTKLSVSGVSGKAHSITYKSSNKKVVSVNKSGKLTAKKKGTATITAVVKVGEVTKTLTKKIKVKKASIKITKKKKSLKKGKSYTYKAKAYGIKKSSLKWSSSKKSVLTITKKGKAKAKKPGKTTVKVSYKKIKSTVKVTVKKK